VVTTKDEKVFWVLDFVSQKEADGFERLLSSVNIIAQEEIV
jgi:hypothetical protein